MACSVGVKPSSLGNHHRKQLGSRNRSANFFLRFAGWMDLFRALVSIGGNPAVIVAGIGSYAVDASVLTRNKKLTLATPSTQIFVSATYDVSHLEAETGQLGTCRATGLAARLLA